MSHVRPASRRWLIGIAALAMTLGAARVASSAETRELKAREEFAAGRYQQALDLFAKLYAETLHPVYLRNIGRCYQNLGEPDRAIISFRDYLRKHKTISAEERKEVEAFIAEMDELKRQRGSTATTEPDPDNLAPAPTSSTIASAPPPPAPEPKSGAAPEALVTAPGGGAHEQPSPVYTRWWFWTLVGAAAVGAGLGIAAATGAFTKTQEGSCTTGYSCQ